MLFKKQVLQDLAWEDYNPSLYQVVENKIVDTSRWSSIYDMVFKFKNKFYSTSYSQAATEGQDEAPYEYESDQIECLEVVPREVVKIVYVNKGGE